MNTSWFDPVLTCADAKALEARLFGGNEAHEWAAMERAGAAVARAALEDIKEIGGLPDAGRLLVLVGKGHNGGDALLAAATILAIHPAASADVVFVFGERTLWPLAARAWRRLTDAARQRVRMISVAASVSEWPCYDLCLDGIFGFQFHPPVDASTAAVLRAVNAHPAIRLRAAVDLPSGVVEHLPVDGGKSGMGVPPMSAGLTKNQSQDSRATPDVQTAYSAGEGAGVVGETSCDATFRADFTYAAGSVKTPLFEERNRDAVGRLRYCDLGFFDLAPVGSPLASDLSGSSGVGCSLASDSFDPSRAVSTSPFDKLRVPSKVEGLRPRACRGASALSTDLVLKPSVLAPLAGLRAPMSDKRTFGHLFVVCGSRSYPGAALMCVRAALRSGVGLVSAFVPESLAPFFAAGAPEAIWVGWPETPEGGLSLDGLHLLRERLPRATALAMGCGLGLEPETHTLAGEIVKLAGVPVVLDAEALQPSVLAAARGKNIICLPHAGEFKRLARGLGGTGILLRSGATKNTGETGFRQDAVASRLPVPRPADAPEPRSDVLRAVAREASAIIVLKGPVTRISDGARTFHSLFGGPVLARGGSGDLLAGLTGGLLAQTPGDPLLAACRGVVWHGMAADLLARDRGQVSVQVTQLLDYLPTALRESAR
jgi:NAD(P)H-hydrate epimerase